jgi:hypothetical protein
MNGRRLAIPLLLCGWLLWRALPAAPAPAAGTAPPGEPAQPTGAGQQEEADQLAEYPREIELAPAGAVRLSLWRGGLELTRRRGRTLTIHAERQRTEDVACQEMTVVRSQDGGVEIQTGPLGARACTELIHLQLGVPEGTRLQATVNHGSVRAESVSGEIELTALAGDVEVSGGEGRLQVQAAGGAIRIVRCGAEMRLESVGERIEVRGGARAPLSARSVSGGIHLSLPELAAIEISAETLGGDIQILYPAGARPSFEIAPGQGALEADFALPETSAGADGERWVRAIEEGRPLLRLRTRRGRIQLQALSGDQEGDFEATGAPTASENI